MPGSLNDVMHKTEVPAFSVSVASLNTHGEWSSILAMGMQHFTVGSVYNNNPSSYYSPFYSSLFDRMVYFDRTTAATQLK
ncbi:MAG: hypothetical protein QM762_21355 [Chryseolinea sp.]